MNPLVAVAVAYAVIAVLLWGLAAMLFVETRKLRRSR